MILIVGGGVIGLTLAFRLLQSGDKITLIERAEIGRGASWAAAGYLEPSLGDSPLAKIEWQSLRMWPDFAKSVEICSGGDVDYQTHGQLRIAYADSAADVHHDFEARKAAGWEAEELSAQQLRALEPALSHDILGATYLPQVHWVDGRKLCKALANAVLKLGGAIHQNTAVQRVNTGQGRVTGVQTDAGEIAGDMVVIAAGYQADLINNLPQDLPKSTGLKGVILTLAGNNTTGLRHLIKRPDGILCPRNDGRVLLGVTRDVGDFTPTATAGTIARLLQSGLRAMPALADMTLAETVVGFRPFAGESDAPSIGESAQIPGLYHSLGHGADGYLRAPYYADALAQMITKSG
ncbi:MAG: FAD-dependent oxidoreductase [Rhodobacteraceae bacterium]|nr:FAD-dependent oxidoreductase [Paracoccaceae bacterium]